MLKTHPVQTPGLIQPCLMHCVAVVQVIKRAETFWPHVGDHSPTALAARLVEAQSCINKENSGPLLLFGTTGSPPRDGLNKRTCTMTSSPSLGRGSRSHCSHCAGAMPDALPAQAMPSVGEAAPQMSRATRREPLRTVAFVRCNPRLQSR